MHTKQTDSCTYKEGRISIVSKRLSWSVETALHLAVVHPVVVDARVGVGVKAVQLLVDL